MQTDCSVKVTHRCVVALLSIVINLRLTSANIKMNIIYTHMHSGLKSHMRQL